MGQPPLSRAVQRLERSLGLELLPRDRSRVRLTEAGASHEPVIEGQVAIVPRGHPIALHPEVSPTEVSAVADLPIARWPRHDGSSPAVTTLLTWPAPPPEGRSEGFRRAAVEVGGRLSMTP